MHVALTCRSLLLAHKQFDIEGWTAFDFEGRGDKYSPMKWTFEHFVRHAFFFA